VTVIRHDFPLVLRGSAVATNVFQPGDAVEFRVDGLDLPCVCLTLRVLGLEDGDTLDCVGWDGGVPSQSNSVASDGVDGHEVEWDFRLRSLASFESSLVGEGRLAKWLTGKLVDAVRPVDKVVGQEHVGHGGGVVGEETAKAADEVLSRGGVQAFAWVHPVSPAGSSRGRGEEGCSSSDSSE